MVVRVRRQSLWKLFVRMTADLLILAGVSGVAVWIWGLSDGAFYQYVQGVQFRQESDPVPEVHKNSAATEGNQHPEIASWIAPALPRRDPLLLGRLEIPNIQLTVMMREGVDDVSLRKAVGHLPSSALPGEIGNMVVLGHRDTFFRPLRGIAQGDAIRVKIRGGTFKYVVESIRVVEPEQSLVYQQDSTAKLLTLITCFPFSYVGPAPRRFVVLARMADPEHVP